MLKRAQKKDIKVIVDKGEYNKLRVSIISRGKKDNKAIFRIWVTKKRTAKPEYEEFMTYDLVNGDPNKFIKEVNELVKLLNQEYFESDFDTRNGDHEEQRKEKQRQYSRAYNKTEKGKASIKKAKEKMKRPVPGYYGYRKWEPEEINFIIKNHGEMTIRQMAIRLKRSYQSTNGMVSRIKNKTV